MVWINIEFLESYMELIHIRALLLGTRTPFCHQRNCERVVFLTNFHVVT